MLNEHHPKSVFWLNRNHIFFCRWVPFQCLLNCCKWFELGHLLFFWWYAENFHIFQIFHRFSLIILPLFWSHRFSFYFFDFFVPISIFGDCLVDLVDNEAQSCWWVNSNVWFSQIFDCIFKLRLLTNILFLIFWG